MSASRALCSQLNAIGMSHDVCYNKVCLRGGGRAEEGLSDSACGSGWLPAGGSDLDDLETVVVWNSCRDYVGL